MEMVLLCAEDRKFPIQIQINHDFDQPTHLSLTGFIHFADEIRLSMRRHQEFQSKPIK